MTRANPRRARRSSKDASNVSRCRWCRADVIWLKHPGTGKLAPIDLHPAPGGNIVVNRAAGTYTVVVPNDLALFDVTKTDVDAQPNLHFNHWVTCTSPTARRLAAERSKGKTGPMTADGEPVGAGARARRTGADPMEAPPEVVAAVTPPPRCAGCDQPMDRTLAVLGETHHPNCYPREP